MPTIKFGERTLDYDASENMNPEFRSDMEDFHVMATSINGIEGFNLFAVFDGHSSGRGGDRLSYWCKKNFPKVSPS